MKCSFELVFIWLFYKMIYASLWKWIWFCTIGIPTMRLSKKIRKWRLEGFAPELFIYSMISFYRLQEPVTRRCCTLNVMDCVIGVIVWCVWYCSMYIDMFKSFLSKLLAAWKHVWTLWICQSLYRLFLSWLGLLQVNVNRDISQRTIGMHSSCFLTQSSYQIIMQWRSAYSCIPQTFELGKVQPEHRLHSSLRREPASNRESLQMFVCQYSQWHSNRSDLSLFPLTVLTG